MLILRAKRKSLMDFVCCFITKQKRERITREKMKNYAREKAGTCREQNGKKIKQVGNIGRYANKNIQFLPALSDQFIKKKKRVSFN